MTVLRSVNPSHANATLSPLGLSSRSFTPSPGNLETQRPADSRMLAAFGLSRLSGPRIIVPARGPGPSLARLPPVIFWSLVCLLLLDRVVFEACGCVRLQPFCAFSSHAWPVARSEQLRQLAVQLASLASLEDVVPHSLQSLLEATSGLIAPISAVERALLAALFLRSRSRSRSPLPKAAYHRSRGSILLSQRGPTGCPSRIVLRLRLTARSPPTAPVLPWSPLLALSSLGRRGPRVRSVRASRRGC